MGTKLVLRHEMSEVSFRELEGKGVSIDTAASIFSMLQFDPVPAEYPFISSEMLEQEVSQAAGSSRVCSDQFVLLRPTCLERNGQPLW